jgi:hypothetical protein
MANQAIINIGPQDIILAVQLPLPAAGANATTAIIDLGVNGGNSNAWQLGRFAIQCQALPENTVAAGITIAMQCAPPSLTNSQPAPGYNVPGAFITPVTTQTTTIAGVAGIGSAAFQGFQVPTFDSTGSTYQFYQWLVTVTAGIVTQGEILTIAWVKDSD